MGVSIVRAFSTGTIVASHRLFTSDKCRNTTARNEYGPYQFGYFFPAERLCYKITCQYKLS